MAVAHEGHKGHMPGALNRLSDHPLVFRAIAGIPASPDLALLVHIALDEVNLFVIQNDRLIRAELAYARPAPESPPASPAPRRRFSTI
jgi:hypothetical protein